MGRGSSKVGGGSGGGGIPKIMQTFDINGVTAAGDMLNDLTRAGDYFIYETPDSTIIYGKTYNDEYYNLNIVGGVRANKKNSDDMANLIHETAGSGRWSIGKYDEIYWTEPARSRRDSGERSAVVLSKLPTNVTATKTGSALGYDIYTINSAPGFFRTVAVKSKK